MGHPEIASRSNHAVGCHWLLRSYYCNLVHSLGEVSWSMAMQPLVPMTDGVTILVA